MDDTPLYMVRLALEQRRLVQLGRRLRLPPSLQDTGYLVHCALKDLFGDLSPKPFVVQGEEGRFLSVLGYVRASKEQLRDQAQLQASPDVHESCDWDTLAAKQMPSSWAAGRRLRFEVRACPVKRKASTDTRHPSPRFRDGAEVDVFLDHCWRVGADVVVNREEVYVSWLAHRLEEAGSRLIQAKMSAFQRKRLLRRDHEEERTSARVERPDVSLEGELEVADPAAFAGLLSRGLGRHRTFGFGMVLVRPA